MLRKWLLLHPDPAAGGSSAPEVNPEPTDPPAPAPESEGGDERPPPHIAEVVLTGQRSEREVQLQAEIDAERAKHAKTVEEKRAREIRINELEDENRQLKLAREQGQSGKPAGEWQDGWEGFFRKD